MVEYGSSCFVHIPKTAGTWIAKVLVEQAGGKVINPAHHLPKKWKSYTDVWVSVRRPDEWLDSFYRWAYRTWGVSIPILLQGRKEIPTPMQYGNDVFQSFCWKMETYIEHPFPKFVEMVTSRERGIISWLYNSYMPPGVYGVRLEDVHEKLRKEGCEPEKVRPENVNPAPPIIDNKARTLIYEAEKWIYDKYGWGVEIK